MLLVLEWIVGTDLTNKHINEMNPTKGALRTCMHIWCIILKKKNQFEF